MYYVYVLKETWTRPGKTGFGGLCIEQQETGITLPSEMLPDQAALQGPEQKHFNSENQGKTWCKDPEEK